MSTMSGKVKLRRRLTINPSWRAVSIVRSFYKTVYKFRLFCSGHVIATCKPYW
jgi:hypothetical protein